MDKDLLKLLVQKILLVIEWFCQELGKTTSDPFSWYLQI